MPPPKYYHNVRSTNSNSAKLSLLLVINFYLYILYFIVIAKEKRFVLAAIGAAASAVNTLFGIPKTIIETVNAFKDLSKKTKNEKAATMLFNVTNYSEWPFTISYKNFEGQSLKNTDNTVIAGKRLFSGGYGEQAKGTEAAAFFDVNDKWQCVFYWRVRSKNREKEPNKMAVGCYPKNDSLQQQIEKQLRSSSDTMDLPICFHEYKNDNLVIGVCGPAEMPFCIDGSMKSDLKNTGRVNVFPKKVKNVAKNFTGEVTQSELDERRKQACDISKDPISGDSRSAMSSIAFILAVLGFSELLV